MAKDRLPTRSTSGEVEAFLNAVARTPARPKSGRRGRLIFGMDATASREASWDRACHLQAEMFAETAALGGLEVLLCYYHGFRGFRRTGWLTDTARLSEIMSRVRCEGGLTQIAKVLSFGIKESEQHPVDALVFVGDCMEEDVDRLCDLGAKLGLLGVPAFMFHEGNDPGAARAFREVARLSGGAYCAFDANSAQQLRDLLSAVAVFAAGGRRALAAFGERRGGDVLRLTHQLPPRGI
jgi:hypothetical protein